MTAQVTEYKALTLVLLDSSASIGRVGHGIRRIGAIGLVPSMGRNDLIKRGQSSGE